MAYGKERTIDMRGLALDISSLKIDGTTVIDNTAETSLDWTLTATTSASNVDGLVATTATEVALGTYANAINGKLDFGTAGAVTGLGGVICAELDLGAGTTSGSYACFEAELNCPSGASTGTRTSFISFNAWGADVATLDSNAYFFDLSGLTGGDNKLFDNDGMSIGAVNEITAGLKVLGPNGVTYRILMATEADAYD